MVEELQEQHQKPEKRIGNYLIDKTLGKGTFGKVKLGIHVLTGEKVAIKILEKEKIVDVADVERVSRQIHILKLIRHPNIIQLYEIIESPKHLFLVMEYMENGELFDYIVKKKKMQEDEACKVFEQIISGIQYIHKLRIVHRDLKLENLLMDYDKTIRIVDFGLSNTYKTEERLKTACGSPCYAAPQMIQSKHPYEPLMVDIWSAGVILYAMVCGCLPFEDNDTPKLYKKILNGQYHMSSKLSKDLQDFIQRILTVDPNQRIRIEEMKEHIWWKKHSENYYPQGLIVGYNRMPIEPKILCEMKDLKFDPDLAEKCIEANHHNSQTTTYYLLLRRFLKEGNTSKADYRSKYFDKSAIEPNQRRPRSYSLKAEDLVKKNSSPHKRIIAKSLYKDKKQNDSFLEQSVKIPRMPLKDKSRSKNKSRSQIKDKSNLKENMNLERENRRSSTGKIMSRSSSKKRKELRDLSLLGDENYHRPRVRMASTTKNKKKSLQGSYLIGADTGIDWPVESKWKMENSIKGRFAPKRR